MSKERKKERFGLIQHPLRTHILCFVGKAGFEPKTLGYQAERF